MQWTKIPTNILINRYTDQEIVAIVKYQLLWADLEYQPDDRTALRYMSNKQLEIVKQYLNDIETQVMRDIRSSETNRNNRKLNYLKNKEKSENVSITVPITVSDTVERQIRIDKNNKENKIKERFVKPSIDEIRAYCEERNNGIDAGNFFDFYESKGWKVGSTPMKDWKACVRTWERSRTSTPKQQTYESTYTDHEREKQKEMANLAELTMKRIREQALKKYGNN